MRSSRKEVIVHFVRTTFSLFLKVKYNFPEYQSYGKPVELFKIFAELKA